MKTLKKLFLTLAVVIMAVVCFAFGAWALEETGKCGENVTYTYNSTTKELVISGTGEMENYYYNESPFCDSDIQSVVISDGVTTISNYMFQDCNSITSIKIGNSVTTIGNSAFYYCESLSRITIPDSVTFIGDWAFSGCDSLTSITIPNSVASIRDYAFSSCDSLTSVTIPDSVTSIGDEAFHSCDNLTSITIPDSVTSIGDEAFSYCKKLESITVDKNNKYYCNDDYGALYNKNKTELIQYPVGNERRTYIIPDGVTIIGISAFEHCLSLENITIPDSVTTIRLDAFDWCYWLSNVYYTGTQSQWNEIMILGNNSYLVDATIYYDWCGSVHKNIVDLKAKNPTCTATGLTNGKKCSTCGTVTVEQKTIAKLGHKEVTVKGKSATCTSTGLTDGKKCSVCGTVTVAQKTIAKKSHTLTIIKSKSSTCTSTGLTEGKKCSVCGTVTVAQKTVAKKSHTYTTTTSKATLTKNGKTETKCTVCGKVSKTTTVYYPKTITLSATSYTYNGKAKTPTVTVKDSKGKELKKDTDYTVKYESGRKSTGKYTVTVTFKGKYSGTKKLYFTITPKTTNKVTATQTTTSVTLNWSKVTGATGYRVFQRVNGKWKTLTNTTKLTYTIKKLKAGTNYTFAVRPYTVDGKDTILASTFTQLKTATKCKTPTLKVTSSKKGVASLSWTNVAGESGYQVYYSTKKDGEYKKVKSYKTDVVTASKSKLTSGKTYYFKIRAYKKTDSGTVYGAWSAVKSVKIK